GLRLRNVANSCRSQDRTRPGSSFANLCQVSVTHATGSARVAAGHTRERTSTLETYTCSRTKSKFLRIGFPLIGSVAPPRRGQRGRPARERGLYENNIILLAPSPPRKGETR